MCIYKQGAASMYRRIRPLSFFLSCASFLTLLLARKGTMTEHKTLDVADGDTKKFVAKHFVSSFSGWHLSTSNALHQKTHAAYAVNGMKEDILQPAEGRYWHHQMKAEYGEDRMNLLLLRPNGAVVASNMDQRYVFFKPLCVNVKGPRVNAIPTMCKVKNYYLKTGLYTILMVKADAYAKAMLQQHVQERGYETGKVEESAYISIEEKVTGWERANVTNSAIKQQQAVVERSRKAYADARTDEKEKKKALDDAKAASLGDTSDEEMALTLSSAAKHHAVYQLESEMDILKNIKFSYKRKHSMSLSDTAGTFLLAMRVRHMCDNDAGAAFRDKRGREGAAIEVENACHAYLSVAYDIQ